MDFFTQTYSLHCLFPLLFALLINYFHVIVFCFIGLWWQKFAIWSYVLCWPVLQTTFHLPFILDKKGYLLMQKSVLPQQKMNVWSLFYVPLLIFLAVKNANSYLQIILIFPKERKNWILKCGAIKSLILLLKF